MSSIDDYDVDYLLEAACQLADEFEKIEIPLIIGGGFSQYIRTLYFNKVQSLRYPNKILQRSTEDIDLFLTADIIVDYKKVTEISSVLSKLNYEVKTEFFQFKKNVQYMGASRGIEVDILTEPPKEEDREKVKIKKPRVKPLESKNFHAFMHNEAYLLSKFLVKTSSYVEPDLQEKFKNIYLPSCFSFLVMKLYAFRDRIDDEKKEFGKHHAYDIFATIINMDEADWNTAAEQRENYQGTNILIEAKKIVSQFFNSEISTGVIRIKENELFQRGKNLFDKYLNNFIADLHELLDISE